MSLLDKYTGLMKPAAIETAKLYGQTPDNTNAMDFTVSRASVASRINEQGFIENVAADVPRLQYPSCPKVLLEPARVNNITYPISFDNAYWTKTNASVIGGYNSPHADYPTSAFKLVESADADITEHYLIKTSIPAVAGNVCFTVIARENGRDWMRLFGFDGTAHHAYFDLVNGEVGALLNATAEIEPLVDGWYCCTLKYNCATTNPQARIFSAVANDDSAYIGDGVSGIYIFGSQHENGEYPTSLMYFGAEGSAINRAMDLMVVQNLILNNVITNTAATILLEIDTNDVVRDSADYIFELGGVNGSIYIHNTSNTVAQYGRVVVESTDGTTMVLTLSQGTNKIVFQVSATDVEVFINGISAGNTGKAFSFTDETLYLRGSGRESEVKQIALFDTTLTDTECIDLST